MPPLGIYLAPKRQRDLPGIPAINLLAEVSKIPVLQYSGH